MGRGRTAIIVVGRRNTGKSTTIAELISKLDENKGIIIDPNGAPAYNHLHAATYEELRRLKKGFVKFYDPDKKKMFDFFLEMYSPLNPDRKYLNGTLCIEDATKIVPKNPPENIKSLLVDGRMWNADLIFTFHSLYGVPPFFWDFATHILIKKTQDLVEQNISEYRSRIPNFQDWYPAWQRVMNHKSPYHYEVVKTLL